MVAPHPADIASKADIIVVARKNHTELKWIHTKAAIINHHFLTALIECFSGQIPLKIFLLLIRLDQFLYTHWYSQAPAV